MVEPESYNIFIFPFAASRIDNLIHSNCGTDVTPSMCTRYSSAGHGCLCFIWSGLLSLLVDSDSSLMTLLFPVALVFFARFLFMFRRFDFISGLLRFAPARRSYAQFFCNLSKIYLQHLLAVCPVSVKRFYCFGSRVRDVRFSCIWNIWRYTWSRIACFGAVFVWILVSFCRTEEFFLRACARYYLLKRGISLGTDYLKLLA